LLLARWKAGQITPYIHAGDISDTTKLEERYLADRPVSERAEAEITPPGAEMYEFRYSAAEQYWKDVENKLFERIVSVMDSTIRPYRSESSPGFKDDSLQLPIELAKCLSALNSLKLMWPLPPGPFDALSLEHVLPVLEDLEASCKTHERIVFVPSPARPTAVRYLDSSVARMRDCQWALEAVVDVATM
jgi:hypothetical protein